MPDFLILLLFFQKRIVRAEIHAKADMVVFGIRAKHTHSLRLPKFFIFFKLPVKEWNNDAN